MRFYFIIQWRRLIRNLKESGLPALPTFLISSILFIFLSNLLSQRFENWPIVYLGIYVFFINQLSEKAKIDFILNVYNRNTTRMIRLIENLLLSLPFVFFLLYSLENDIVLILILLGISQSFVTKSFKIQLVIPTPFAKRPFEFIRGFRKTFPLLLLLYSLAVISIIYNNFNLGVVVFALSFLICMSFYSKPEPQFYVWIHTMSPKMFIQHKFQILARETIIVTFPICLILMGGHLELSHWILLAEIIGICLVGLNMLCKYASYPKEMNLIDGLLITSAFAFPPLLFIIGPLFYLRSLKKLKYLLHD
jgi:hypothetical protein